jgi:diaminohydroxyphosphoribosylaminopyrimidine deaminase / 5-amino-6-(5-phosphoribosylamino)uracil reductase
VSVRPGDDVAAMRRALELAERGWGRVHPNPLVGAVVVAANGQRVGEGWHAEYGAPHAEIVALAQAGPAAAGGTLYVTLEPCAHHGKTPPCTEAIERAGIRRVVYAVADPNPQARGGEAQLRARGIAVEAGVEAAAARAQNRIFFHVHERQRCYLALKLAITLDARLGMSGERTRLTGAAAGRAVQRLRAGFEAVLVGAGTARVDDPLLTVRDGAVRLPPRRVVFDPSASLPPDAQLVRTVEDARVTVVCAPDASAERRAALEARGVQVLVDPRAWVGLALDAALERLWQDGVRSILCEGGGVLAAALLAAGLVDRLHLLVAPRLLGGRGVPAFPLPDIGGDLAWRLEHVERLDGDVMLEYAPRGSGKE